MTNMNFNTDTDINESEFSDIAKYDTITEENMNIVYDILGEIIILNRFKDNVGYLFNRVIDTAVLVWNNKWKKIDKLQHMPINFKVDNEDVQTFTLPFNRFMMSIPFIEPVIEFVTQETIENYIVSEALTEERRREIQDNIVSELTHQGFSIMEVQENIANMSLHLKELLNIFSEADMILYTAENLFLDHYKNSEIIREINNTEYPKTMQTSEIVKENEKKYKELAAEMIRLGNPSFLANKYTSVLKPKQVEESYINFAQIPDGKNIIPIIMNGNGFKAGYDKPETMYAGAIAARVPDIVNEKYMGSAGYFQRNLMILTYGTISKTVYDCGSRNPIPIVVDEVVLKMFEGRYYYKSRNSHILRVLKSTDTDLIGEKLWFRSPCTCNLNEDKCHVCYGSLALKVGNLKGGFIYTTSQTTMAVGANILKAKHILKGDAEPVIFSGCFDDWFIMESSSVSPKDGKRFDIYIKEDYQDDLSNGFTCYIGKDMIEVGIAHYASIHILESVLEKAKEVIINDENYYKISSYKILDSDGVFCNITPISISTSAVFMNIMKLFEPGDNGISKYDRIEDVVMVLMNMLHKNIDVLSTHGEIMLAQLIRRVDNKLLKPDWTKEDPEYVMLPLKMALQNSESSTIGLAFEQSRHHMLDMIVEERNKINRVGPRSFCDFIFGEEYL